MANRAFAEMGLHGREPFDAYFSGRDPDALAPLCNALV